jgi:hypothetical protein
VPPQSRLKVRVPAHGNRGADLARAVEIEQLATSFGQLCKFCDVVVVKIVSGGDFTALSGNTLT